LGYLTLRVDGNTNSLSLTNLIVRDLINVKLPSIAGDTKYFSETRKGWENLCLIDAQAKAVLLEKAKEDEKLANLIGQVYDKAISVLEMIPGDRTKIAAKILGNIEGEDIEKIFSLAMSTNAYNDEKGKFGILPITKAKRERNRLRKDISGRFSEYLTIDLSAILSGYRRKDILKIVLPSKLDGIDHCLMIIDDYEKLNCTLDDFLRIDLIPRFQKVKFQTIIIILGRDSVFDVHYDWKKKYLNNVKLNICLKPLKIGAARKLLKDLGIVDVKTRARIIKDTHCLPLLLVLEAESELMGSIGSALANQSYLDRTMHCMSQTQKEWAIALAFLEIVNEDTVKCMLPDADPKEILDWFKKESSIRYPSADKWSILPIIKSRCQASVQNDSPSRFKCYKERATKAAALND